MILASLTDNPQFAGILDTLSSGNFESLVDPSVGHEALPFVTEHRRFLFVHTIRQQRRAELPPFIINSSTASGSRPDAFRS
jgi:hypothetical protein